MDKKKILVLIILSVFVVGMVMGSATASHTFKSKGYKYTMSTKDVKKSKKYAKKYGSDSNHKKVSKTKNKYSYESLKVGKTYNAFGEKFKVLKLVKKHSSSGVGDGGYTYKVKYYAKMNCKISYANGKYYYSAKVY